VAEPKVTVQSSTVLLVPISVPPVGKVDPPAGGVVPGVVAPGVLFSGTVMLLITCLSAALLIESVKELRLPVAKQISGITQQIHKNNNIAPIISRFLLLPLDFCIEAEVPLLNIELPVVALLTGEPIEELVEEPVGIIISLALAAVEAAPEVGSESVGINVRLINKLHYLDLI